MLTKTVKNSRIQAWILIGSFIGAVLALSLAPAVTAQTPPAPTPAGVTFDQRLAQRKAERNVALDEKSQKRLQSTCVRAQSKVRTLQQKTSSSFTERSKVNQGMDAKLWVMIGKLKLAEKDTFNLEKQRSTLAEKITVFQSTAQLYQQSLDDLGVVNCQADPIGFKALLDTSRIYRAQLREQSTGIRNYVVNDIKPTLSGFATDLQAKPAQEEVN